MTHVEPGPTQREGLCSRKKAQACPRNSLAIAYSMFAVTAAQNWHTCTKPPSRDQRPSRVLQPQLQEDSSLDQHSTVQYSNCGKGSQTSALASEPRAHEEHRGLLGLPGVCTETERGMLHAYPGALSVYKQDHPRAATHAATQSEQSTNSHL